MGRAVERGLSSAPNGNAAILGFHFARFVGEGATLSGDLSVLNAVGAMFRQMP